MDGATDERSLSVGDRAAVPAAHRDPIFGQEFVKQVKAMGTKQVGVGAAFPVATCLLGAGSSARSAASAWIT
jgi:hypothetical protein